jgi:hypothetical protein
MVSLIVRVAYFDKYFFAQTGKNYTREYEEINGTNPSPRVFPEKWNHVPKTGNDS